MFNSQIKMKISITKRHNIIHYIANYYSYNANMYNYEKQV